MLKYSTQKKIIIVGFLFLPMALMVLFLVYPTIRMTFYSFTDWDGVMPRFNFVGLQNYKRVLEEPVIWLSLKNNMVYVFTGILANIVALFFAVLLNGKMKGSKFYKTVIFLPYILNVTAIAYMFKFIYDYREGPINMLMRYLGHEPIAFFTDENIAIFTLASMSFWRWLGYMTVIYIAAMQSIEKNLYEASDIDGANIWQSFRFITLPGIIRIVELQMFLSLSGALQAFTETLVLTKGGPGKATYTFMYYVIDAYTVFNDYGFAAAMSVMLVIMIFFITRVQNMLIMRREEV